MKRNTQTGSRDAEATVAFRTNQAIKSFIQAAAATRGVLPSDWLRSVVEKALEEEFGLVPGGGRPRSPEEHALHRSHRLLEAEDGLV